MATDSRPVGDYIDFTVTESKPADNDIDFNVTDSIVVNDESGLAVNTNKNFKNTAKKNQQKI